MSKKPPEENKRISPGSGMARACSCGAQAEPAAGGVQPALFSLAAGRSKKLGRRQRALFDNVPEIAWIKDRDGRFISVSALFADACGIPQEDLIGKTDWDIWPRELAKKYAAQEARILRSGLPMRARDGAVDRNGANRWSEIVRTPIFDNSGMILGTLGIARDVSAQKQAASHLRLVARQVLRAREEEKKSLSSLLHDEIGSIIVRLNSLLVLTEGEVREGNRRPALAKIRNTKKTVRELAARIRNICGDIRPPAMGVSGLGGAITELARRVSDCAPVEIHCDIRLPDEAKIDDLVKIMVYRITQEALNNAIKHSGARDVKITITGGGGRLKLSIGDDGKGFDASKAGAHDNRPNLGLKIMREEAESVCAALSVDSIPGFGTVVKGEFPFQPGPGGESDAN